MARQFALEIKSPSGKHLEDQAELLNIRLSDGQVGIMKDHVPLIGIIEISHFNYVKEGKVYDFAIAGGILNVTKEKVMILADSYESKEEIDIERAKSAQERAEGLLKAAKEGNKEDIDIKRASLALQRAINRLSLTSRK